jgi:hypothetical protein
MHDVEPGIRSSGNLDSENTSSSQTCISEPWLAEMRFRPISEVNFSEKCFSDLRIFVHAMVVGLQQSPRPPAGDSRATSVAYLAESSRDFSRGLTGDGDESDIWAFRGVWGCARGTLEA